ncbi:MAG: hydrogenase expression protein [Synergistaceae bacterium]|jgi:hydrogenase maturation factor|nr:hydrogenase expression protein [Synergistaceae bacterium]
MREKRETSANEARSGKLAPDALERAVFANTGKIRSEVLVGPAVGEDAAVIRWPEGKLLVFASDPIVGADLGSGRLLVRVNVNDIASKGAEPCFIAVTLILPPEMGESAVASIMSEIHDECRVNGIAVVGGHTELNDLYTRPVLSAALIGTADRVFRASDVTSGDVLFVSKHIGIEGMAILASDRPDLLEGVFSKEETAEIRGWMSLTSVLSESRLLRGYASFMHDPTEGGFMGGLDEICRLAGLDADISVGAVPLHPYTRRAAAALGFDPLRLVASGSMIAAVPADRADSVQSAFSDASIDIARVGAMRARREDGEPCRGGASEELWSLLKRAKRAKDLA